MNSALPLCDTCKGRLDETPQRHGNFPWAVLLICSNCQRRCYCCDRSCCPKTSQVTPFRFNSQLVNHHYRQHKKPRLTTQDRESSDACHVDEVPIYQIPTDAFKVFHAHAPTKRFFDDLLTHSFGAAAQNLVARSCFLDARIRNTANAGISVTDLILFLRIARLVFQLGPKHQHLLGGVLSGFETRYRPPSFDCMTRPCDDLYLPTTHKAFVAKILNHTNTNSLTSIIPLPPTACLSFQHAYVAIPGLIAYDLGLANAKVDPPFNSKFQRLVNSLHGQTLFRRARTKLLAEVATINAAHLSFLPLVVLFMMWFDGWDPNGSSKGNRSPVWSGSLTMVFVNLQGCVMSVTTYPFASGPGKADHDVIFERILVDVQALQAPLDNDVQGDRWYYSRLAAQMALVYGELFCIWQDQPARRQETNLLGGNSNNHVIFGTSCYATQLQTPIPACPSCRKATIMYLENDRFQEALFTGCSECTNWKFPDDPNSSLYRTAISDVFPANAVAGREFNHGGGLIDTSVLVSAWREACAAVVATTWSDASVKVYLKVLCVNDATVKRLIDQCKQHLLWQEIGRDPDNYDEPTKALYRRKYAVNPRLFAIPEPPAAWTLCSLGEHPETIMHLSGGVQKAVAKFVHRYATSLGNGPALTTRLAFPISLIHKYCRLQSLPLAAYNTDKFGGWVMENYKSLCKLAPWLYHCLEDSALQKRTPYVMPSKARLTWNGTENKAYLRSRGISTPRTMLAPAAKILVAEMFERTEGPPDEIVNEAASVDPRDMRRLWQSCSSMFKDLMRVNHDSGTVNRTDARVRAFLSQIEALDAVLQPARFKPLYLAKYNFPSLLRAVKHLKTFGNIRDLHEGGIEGEAMVKVLRPLMPNGLKDKFAYHLLRKSLRDKTVDRLLLNLEEGGEDTATARYFQELVEKVDRPTIEFNDNADSNLIDDDDEEDDEDSEEDDTEDPFEQMRDTLEDSDDTGGGEAHEVEPSPLLFRRYSTRAMVESYFTLGVPVSVVVTARTGPQRMGVIVTTKNDWQLLPLHIGHMQYDDELGFTYFQISLYPTEEDIRVRSKKDGEKPTHHVQLLNYAILLPALWLEAPFPYALMTMEGDHLDANLAFV